MYTKPKSHEDQVLMEYPPAGKYRIRLIKGEEGPLFDVREYVQGGSFSGFTRRGIRIRGVSDLEALRAALDEAIGAMRGLRS